MAQSCRNFGFKVCLRIAQKLCLNTIVYHKSYGTVSMSEAISRAELCLGYSLKELSVKQIAFNQKIQSLMSDKSLVQPIEHPVLLAERKLDPEVESNYKSHALVTLLLAKVVSVPFEKQTVPQFKFNLNLNKTGFLTNQLLLAETIELIYGGSVFHTVGVSPIKNLATGADNTIDSLLKGNRLAILRGDLMFSMATKNLVKLRNSRVTELMSRALRDFVEGEYLCIKIKEQIESTDWTGILDNWVRMTGLKSASLITNGCQSMIHLSGNCESLEESVCKFGNNIGFAWNVLEELTDFQRIRNHKLSSNTNICDSNVYSLPILLHLNSNPELKMQFKSQNRNVFIENITEEVSKGDAIKKAESLLHFYSGQALGQLNRFADSDAKSALSNILLALKHR